MGCESINFPKGTKILVTGAAGFIGSNICEALLKLGVSVLALDDFSNGKRENVEELLQNPLYEFTEGSIVDIQTCQKCCEGADYILHQAAWGSVPRSLKMPPAYLENNIKGTSNMMQAAFEAGVKRFVYASSSSVYGDSTALPKVEGKEGNVLAPYGLTKRVNEEYGDLYYRIYGLKTIGLRYFNVFGRRQDPYSAYAAVIPIFVKSILNGKAPTIYGNGEQSRDFTYVENVIEANLKACLAGEAACGQVFNVAYGGNTTLNQLYNKLSELMGSSLRPNYGGERTGDIKHSLADISKAKRLLGYSPLYDFDKGIEDTIEWYKNYLA
ncbi:MAG: SDR family oxidoreductase [Oscillospiraceae bacterium]|jgi:UDP-N-acetylglucosamine 4-epimerase|nr:SDR family oxidoreductase [Oscillospiraceae bacterium]